VGGKYTKQFLKSGSGKELSLMAEGFLREVFPRRNWKAKSLYILKLFFMKPEEPNLHTGFQYYRLQFFFSGISGGQV